MKNLVTNLQARNPDRTKDLTAQSTLEANNVVAVALFLIVLIGGFIRFQYVRPDDFPLNDGGLFYTMTRDLISNGWKLPVTTSYNHLNIPFGYPPLGFYLAGFFSSALGFNLLQEFRFIPLIFSILTIPAFYLLARELLENDAQAIYATFAFALLPPAFEWLIMGGGITRSPGLLFALLTLYQALAAMRTGKPVHFLAVAVCGALTALFHLEMLWLTAISGLFFGLILARNRRGLILGAIFGLGVGILTSPYWLTVIRLNGLVAFTTAFKGNGINPLYSTLTLLASNFTAEPFFTLFGVLALIGVFFATLRKNWLVTGWLLVLLFLNPRSINRSCILPVAMLAGMAIHTVVLPGIGGAWNHLSETRKSGNLIDDLRPKANQTAFSLLMVWALISGVFRYYLGNAPLLSLSSPQQAAMAWVNTHTLPSSRFFVLPSTLDWNADRVLEWFPTLTDRTSLTTVQGHEWISQTEFDAFQYTSRRILACTPADLSCIEKLAVLDGGYDYVYVSLKADTREVTLFNLSVADRSLENNPTFEKVYENTDVAIYRHQPAG
jgi:hypothetical protein